MANLNRMSALFVYGTKADPADDVRVITLALRCHQPNVPDLLDDWDDDLREKVEDEFLDKVWTPLRTVTSSAIRLIALDWHEIGEAREEGYPRLRRREVDIAATANAGIAPQTACTVTLQTPIRKRWGRVYLPGPTGISGTDHRFSSASLDTRVNAFKAFFDSAFDLTSLLSRSVGAYPVVVVRSSLTDGQPGVNVTRVIGLRADDIPDVMRSRRFRRANYRKIVELENT